MIGGLVYSAPDDWGHYPRFDSGIGRYVGRYPPTEAPKMLVDK